MENLLSDKPLPTGQILESIGYSQGVTETPSMVLESHGFKEALQEIGLKEALVQQGINPQKIAEKVNVLLNAESVKYKNNVTTGKIEEVGREPDFNAIDKGLKHATAIYGIVPDAPKGNTTYNFILNPTFREKVQPLEEELKKQFKNARPTETTE